MVGSRRKVEAALQTRQAQAKSRRCELLSVSTELSRFLPSFLQLLTSRTPCYTLVQELEHSLRISLVMTEGDADRQQEREREEDEDDLMQWEVSTLIMVTRA